MLDMRSKTLLNYLVGECSQGSYRVFETKELLGIMPKKFKADNTTILQCMQYLEKGNYISIKYKDGNMYCVSPLPFARQLLENESNQKQKTKKFVTMGSVLYLLIFVFAFLGSFLAILFYGMIF